MAWGAVAAAAASLGSAYLGSKSSKDAADEGSKSADAAARAQLAAYAQSRVDSAPYRQAGGHFLDAYSRAMGLPAYNPNDQRYNQIDPNFQSLLDKYGGTGRGPVNISSLVSTGTQQGRREILADPNTGFGYYLKKKGKKAIPTGQRVPGFEPQQSFLGGSETNPAAPTGDPADRYGGFYESPAYRFNLDEALQSVERSAGASGYLPTGPGALSGRFSKEMARYASGLASNEFGDYLNRLAAGAGIGQTTSSQSGFAAMNTASNYGNAMIERGNARASGILGQGEAARGAIDDATSYAKHRGWI